MADEQTEKLAEYPWDKCIQDQAARYGSEETAAKVCGMIRDKYGMGSMNLPLTFSLEAVYPEIEKELGCKPKDDEDEMSGLQSGFQFVELANAQGKAFDGVASGSFIDMHGRVVVIKATDMPTYLKNTQAAIEASKTESGELVGLPIDARNHENGDAAGWIVGVELAGGVLRFIPKWTQIGVDLITGGIRRMFSPTVDLVNKVVVGGTLTNWPASRDRSGKVLLRPIELCQSILSVETGGGEAADTKTNPNKEIDMTVKLQDLTPEERAELAKQVAVELAKDVQPTPPAQTVDLSSLLEIDGLSEEAKKQRKEELRAQLVAIRKQAELEYKAELSRLQHESNMTELAGKLTGGTSECPKGYRVSAEDLRAHLLKLDPEEAKFWGDLMGRTASEGFVEFAELGHGKQMKGTAELPPEVVAKLESGDFKVADLANPILGLGDLSQYNLSKWSK